MKKISPLVAAAVAALALPTLAAAQETTLRAVSAFAENTEYVRKLYCIFLPKPAVAKSVAAE